MAKKYITPVIFAIEMEGEELLSEVSGNAEGNKVVGITFGGDTESSARGDSKSRNSVVDMGDDEEW